MTVQWEIPVFFHSLGVELQPEQRVAHLAEVAAELWSGGTDFQRSTVAGWYAEIAASAVAEGASYAGFSLLGTDDDRVSTATLVVLAEQADTSDPEVAAAALQELLSTDPAHEVFRTRVTCGPAVVVLSGLAMELADGVTLELAVAEAHLPVPGADTLLVLRMSTPSLPELPDYVGLLARIAESVRYEVPLPRSRISEAFG